MTPSGAVIAAMNTSTEASHGAAADIVRDLLPLLKETAAAIGADLRVSSRVPTRLSPEATVCRTAGSPAYRGITRG